MPLSIRYYFGDTQSNQLCTQRISIVYKLISNHLSGKMQPAKKQSIFINTNSTFFIGISLWTFI